MDANEVRRVRAALLADPDVGAGNALVKVIEHGASPDGPGITFDVPVDGIPAWAPLTLGVLRDRVAARAAWLHRRGIRPRDPVAVYVTSSADLLLNFMALTWLGAIPALMNGGLPPDVAAGFIARLRGTGVIVDAAHRDLLDGQRVHGEHSPGQHGHQSPGEHSPGQRIHGEDSPGERGPGGHGSGERGPGGHSSGERSSGGHGPGQHGQQVIVMDAAETGTGDPGDAPAHYRHHPDDPVAITHSSGTTRVPAAVVHSHGSIFAAIRLVHLRSARSTERTLCVFPAAHAAGIISTQLALCNRHEHAFMSGQGGQWADSGAAVLDAIERWRPTGVYGFAVTWSALARHDLGKRDLSSVRLWFNTGDSVHETHVRRLVAVGSHVEYSREKGASLEPGSKFIDGIGSSEMGHSGFRVVHTPTTGNYNRCVGKPYDFAEIRLFDVDKGIEVRPGQVGQVGMKSPTLALGYWNDSVNTYRTRLRGYYLTGDLMYQDSDGLYYHVDRAADAVDLGDGNWLYTAMSEERILVRCPDVWDCTVIAGRDTGGAIACDVFLQLAPGAQPDKDRTAAIRGALGEAAASTLRHVAVVGDDEIVLGPTGKVRKFLMRERHLAGASPS